MKSFGHRIDSFLWENSYEQFNKVGYSAPCISFLKMQIIRFINLIINFICWCLVMYVNVKKCVIYFYIWALTYTVLAFGFLFVSSGRQVVERKLAEKGEIISEKERSTSWKWGVFFYQLSLSTVFTANVLYFALIRQDLNLQVEFDFSSGFYTWRNVLVWIGHLLPLLCLIVDFMLNRIVFSHRHYLITFIIVIAYLFFTFVGQLIQSGKAVYIEHLNWQQQQFNFDTCIQNVTLSYIDEQAVWINLCPTPNWSMNLITMAVLIASSFVFHVIFCEISKRKSIKYFQSDSEEKENQFQVQQEDDAIDKVKTK